MPEHEMYKKTYYIKYVKNFSLSIVAELKYEYKVINVTENVRRKISADIYSELMWRNLTQTMQNVFRGKLPATSKECSMTQLNMSGV